MYRTIASISQIARGFAERPRTYWFERTFAYTSFAERTLLLPVLYLSILTECAPGLASEAKLGPVLGALVVSVCALKLLRSSLGNVALHYKVLLFAYLLFRFDLARYSESLLLDAFVLSLLVPVVRSCVHGPMRMRMRMRMRPLAKRPVAVALVVLNAARILVCVCRWRTCC